MKHHTRHAIVAIIMAEFQNNFSPHLQRDISQATPRPVSIAWVNYKLNNDTNEIFSKLFSG